SIQKKAYVEPVQPSFKVDTEKKEMTIDTGTAGIDLDVESTVAAVTDALETLSFEDSIKVEPVSVPQDKVDAEAMAKEATTEPKNAGVKSDGKTLIEAVDGIKVTAEAITEAIGDGSEQTYTLPVEANKAKVTAADLEPVLFRDTLASVTTTLNPNLTGRTTNVRLAMKACNGTILNPGDTFSYNDIVGERTAARGYQSAIVFENGEQVPGLGGGVCQGSSTIYMAVLRADLKVTERRSHTFQVSYTPIAQDATVAYGSQDFKFVNNTDYPIKVVTSLEGSTVSCKLIGTKTQEKEVRLYASGAAYSGGYKHVSLYKEVTVNGKTTTTVENNSSYKIE
ncbi:MAG: VanW family protein, partial [Butyricicoccaceae bacterium]